MKTEETTRPSETSYSVRLENEVEDWLEDTVKRSAIKKKPGLNLRLDALPTSDEVQSHSNVGCTVNEVEDWLEDTVKRPVIKKKPGLNLGLDALPTSDKLPSQFKAPLKSVEEGTMTPEPEQISTWISPNLKLPLTKIQHSMIHQSWTPETFGFDLEEDLEFEMHPTVLMRVIKDLENRESSSPQYSPEVKAEVSGAASGAAIIGTGSIIGNILKYTNNLLIQRGFGAGPYGLYALGMSTVTLAISIFNLGLDDAMVRYVSIYRGRNQASLLRGLTLFCTALAGIAGILGALLVVFFAPFLVAIRHAPTMLPILLLMAPLVALSSMQNIWTGGMQGFKAFKWRILVQRLVVPGTLTILLIFVLLFSKNLATVVLATLVSALIGVLFNLFFFFRLMSHTKYTGKEEYQLREWISFALPNFLTSILDTVLEAVDTILLAFLVVSIVAVGQYAAAIRYSAFIALPLQSLNVMFAPTIAELHHKGEKEKLEVMFKVVTNWVIIFSLPICLIAILFSRPLLGISGDSFLAAWPLLVVLSVGSMVNAGTGSVGYILLMTGHQKLSFINSLTAVIVNVVLGIILTKLYGALGTAIATGLALAIVNLMRLLQVRLLLKIHPYRWDTLKPLGAGLISSLLIGALLYFLNLAQISLRVSRFNFSSELLLIPVLLVIYVALLILFKFSPEDQIVINKLRKKLRGRKK
ncbi:MAG TPA: flippase [Ktedonobacteraceae bacterium]|nr:flippase [Ktedonobacteraceae bacterium]